MDRHRTLLNSPGKDGSTPIKQLPFSPSQFLNSPNLSFDVTLSSTPVKQLHQLSTPNKDEYARVINSFKSKISRFILIFCFFFKDRNYSPLSTPNGLPHPEPTASTSDVVTPNKGDRSSLLNDVTRTPTPFKKALADLEKKSGPLKNLPDTPTRLEDITEIVKKEQDLSMQYETDSSMMISVSLVFK